MGYMGILLSYTQTIFYLLMGDYIPKLLSIYLRGSTYVGTIGFRVPGPLRARHEPHGLRVFTASAVARQNLLSSRPEGDTI